jgi:hypothetical protein
VPPEPAELSSASHGMNASACCFPIKVANARRRLGLNSMTSSGATPARDANFRLTHARGRDRVAVPRCGVGRRRRRSRRRRRLRSDRVVEGLAGPARFRDRIGGRNPATDAAASNSSTSLTRWWPTIGTGRSTLGSIGLPPTSRGARRLIS